MPDIHTDRARSGAAQAAQGPRTGAVGRRDSGTGTEHLKPGRSIPHLPRQALAQLVMVRVMRMATSGPVPLDLHYTVNTHPLFGQFPAHRYRLLTDLHPAHTPHSLQRQQAETPTGKPLEQQRGQGKSKARHERATTSGSSSFMTACHRCPTIPLLTCRTLYRTTY